ncbi:MAG: hydrolase [Myxococcales bacterium]|nr:hydrolase [Myxococcales bacterium]
MGFLMAVGQMTATEHMEDNLAACERLVQAASQAGAQMLCLPENFSFLGVEDQDNKKVADTLDGSSLKPFLALARKHQLWLSLGGYPEKNPNSDRPFNTHLLVTPEGQIESTYQKTHLFDVTLPTGQELKESKGITPGDRLEVTKTPMGTFGLSVCYDLRFPELYVALRQLGANILLIPAAFTTPTGMAHWETLLRARAIENQCYVVAAAQVGRHNKNRHSYGHAMIIDPWGTVIAQVGGKEGIALAPINIEKANDIRQRMPVMDHRRKDLYHQGN